MIAIKNLLWLCCCLFSYLFIYCDGAMPGQMNLVAFIFFEKHIGISVDRHWNATNINCLQWLVMPSRRMTTVCNKYLHYTLKCFHNSKCGTQLKCDIYCKKESLIVFFLLSFSISILFLFYYWISISLSISQVNLINLNISTSYMAVCGIIYVLWIYVCVLCVWYVKNIKL